jgi:hypothetical protein
MVQHQATWWISCRHMSEIRLPWSPANSQIPVGHLWCQDFHRRSIPLVECHAPRGKGGGILLPLGDN